MVKGLVIIGVIYLTICLTEMTVLKIILESLFGTLMIAIVIMLQPELQKIVELIGQKGLTDIKSIVVKSPEVPTWYNEDTINKIVSACETMSKAKTGALIVIERGIPLSECIDSGINVGASVSSQLLLNIFEKNTPLHDGAIIIKNNKIESATCYLPLSNNMMIDKSLGTRHRAAIGISETTDCVVVVVSEETGEMSLCYDGKIKHGMSKEELINALKTRMNKTDGKILRKRKKSKSPVWIKVVAPLLSVVIWFSVMSVSDPVITATISDVPVKTTNTELLDDAGQAYTVKSGAKIDVKIRGRRSLVDKITTNDIIAQADFSEMSVVNSVPITISMSEQYNDIEVTGDSHVMKLSLEEMIQTEIPVEVTIIGDTNNNVVLSLQKIEKNTMSVTCPESIAETLDKAILTVDAYGKDKDFIVAIEPVIYDKNGDIIENESLTISDKTIRVSINVFEVKKVPIKIELIEQDKNSDSYYEMNSAVPEIDYIKVAGPVDVISTLNEIVLYVSPGEDADLISNVLININPYLPEYVLLAKDQNDQISIGVNLTKFKRHTIGLTADKIKINNVVSQLSPRITTCPNMIVLYYDTSLVSPQTLTLETLNPTIKIQTNNVGQYSTDLILTDIDGVLIIDPLAVQYVMER